MPLTSVHADIQNITTANAVYVRKTDPVKDLQPDQYEDEEDNDVEGLETRFYDSFIAGDSIESTIKREKRVYGRRKPQLATSGRFNVGDTVLMNTVNRKQPSVAVLVAIWKIFINDEERWTNVRVHWFSRESDLPQHRSRRDILEVSSLH